MATQVGVGWRGGGQRQQSAGAEAGSAAAAAAGGAFGQKMRTRDLLGGSSTHNEIDIDLDVEPQTISLSLSGWEKRLDMKSGKVYFHNCNAKENTTDGALHDLNYPPSPLSCPVGDSDALKEGSPTFCELDWLCRVTGGRIEDAAVRPLEELNFMGKAASISHHDTNTVISSEEKELKLNLKLSHEEGASEWQSVCTLDKVRMALKRAEKDSGKRKNDSPPCAVESIWGKRDRSPSLSSSSCSSLGLSLQNSEGEGEGERSSSGGGAAALQAAGCPRCLVYVLLPKANPKCPRCGYFILLNRDLPSFKRPRLHTPSEREEAHSHVKSASSLPFDLNSVL